MKKTKIIENVFVEKIWYQGVWIVKLPDWKILIIKWGVLPWMTVDVKITKKKKDYLEWQIIKVKSFKQNIDAKKLKEEFKSNHQPLDLEICKLCRHNFILEQFFEDEEIFSKVWCWWCKWQLLPYDKQVDLKDKIVKDSFNWLDFFDKAYEWILPAEKIFNYRNKMEFSFWKMVMKKDKTNQVYSDWSLGFHKQGNFSKVVDVSSCLIAWEWINKIFTYLKNIFKESGLPVYDNYNHSWFFRHLVIREWFNTGQILVNLSVATKFFDENKDKINLWTNLQKKLYDDEFLRKNITTFVITENNELADVVKWNNIKVYNLRGWWHIFEKLNFKDTQLTFRISAFSFFQTNTLQAQVLFETAINMLPKIKWDILDLYCGAWTIGITLLKLWIWNNLLGIEVVKDAIVDANVNAKLNWLTSKVKFIANKAESVDFSDSNYSLVVVDPPRSWLHKNVIKFLHNLKKKNDFVLLYISCNPVTMARDLKLLVELWFNVKKLKAVDMFPHTHHIEMIWVVV